MIKLGLSDNDPMPIGRYKGLPMKQVPIEYLKTFSGKVPKSRFNRDVHEYIEDNILNK